MEQQNATMADEPNAGTFAAELHELGVCKVGPSARDDPETIVTANIMPRELDVADEIADKHGFERVNNEMDRRTFKPAN